MGMRYHCRECSYQGPKVDNRGGCPACGSLDIHISAGEKAPEPPKSRKLQFGIMVFLWAAFAVMVLWKLWA